MNGKHTPEPWYLLVTSGKFVGQGIMDADRWMIAPRVETYDDASRIVACVNACAGMDDPAAEIAGMRSALRALAAYFTSGNDVPVERATIRAESDAVRLMRKALEGMP